MRVFHATVSDGVHVDGKFIPGRDISLFHEDQRIRGIKEMVVDLDGAGISVGIGLRGDFFTEAPPLDSDVTVTFYCPETGAQVDSFAGQLRDVWKVQWKVRGDE